MNTATEQADPAANLFGDASITFHDEPEPTLSERFMTGDLTKHLLAILKNQTVVFAEKTEREQSEEIDRLQHRVKQCVRQAVAIIAAQGCTKIHATVEAVNIKPDGIKATLTVPTTSAERHFLFDAAGDEVLIVLPQYELALGGDAPKVEPKPEPAQQGDAADAQAGDAVATGPDLADQASAT